METSAQITNNPIQALNLKCEKNMSHVSKTKTEISHSTENHNTKINIQVNMSLKNLSTTKIKSIHHSINHSKVILHTKPAILKNKSILMTKKYHNNMISLQDTNLTEKLLMVIVSLIKSQILTKAINHINL